MLVYLAMMPRWSRFQHRAHGTTLRQKIIPQSKLWTVQGWTTEVWLCVLFGPQRCGSPCLALKIHMCQLISGPLFSISILRDFHRYWTSFPFNSLKHKELHYIPFPWISVLLVLPYLWWLLGGLTHSSKRDHILWPKIELLFQGRH